MIKLNVGACRKVTDNHYGSKGGNVNIELELDSSLALDSQSSETIFESYLTWQMHLYRKSCSLTTSMHALKILTSSVMVLILMALAQVTQFLCQQCAMRARNS